MLAMARSAELGSGMRIARLWRPPTAMALAVPLVPFTESGGIASPFPKMSLPQQTTAWLLAWIAQL